MSRYDIYKLLDKEVKCFSKNNKINGICKNIYRNPLTHTIKIEVGRKKTIFREPYKISSFDNRIVLEYWDTEENVITETVELFYKNVEKEKPKRKRRKKSIKKKKSKSK